MMRRFESSERNTPYRKGIVKENDYDKRRVKVQFADEDKNESMWISLPTRGSKGNVEVDDFAEGEMVHCLVDWDGESGIVIGGAFNEKDPAPWNDANKRGRKFSDGAEITHNTDTGTTEATAQTVNLGPDGRVKAAGIGHLVHVTYGSSAGLHPIVTGSPSVFIKG